MTKRKCGTCRFFDDGGLAGSGWCTHSSRREWHNLVMVRKSELACRNSWDQDLWQPRLDEAVAQSGAGDQPAEAPSNGLEIPAPTVDDASQQAAASRVSRNDYTDKITNIGVPLTQPDAPPRGATSSRQPDPLPRTDVFDGVRDPRTAVRDVHRKKQEQFDAQRHGAVPTPAARDTPAARLAPPLSAGDDDQPPIVRVPRTDRTRRDLPIPLPSTLPPAPIDGLPGSRQSQPSEASQQSASVERTPAPRKPSPRAQSPTPAPARRVLPPSATEQLPIADVQALLETGAAAPRPAPPVAPRRAPAHVDQPLSDHTERRPPANERGRPAARRLPQARIEDWPGLEASHYTVVPPRAELPMALDVDPVDSSQRLLGVPRCCGTCRDFRRDEDGEQGWCANPHAFAQRRMVQSSELACRSSIGVWWLPHDELWLEHADITHHGRPTPLMDGLGRDLMLNKQAMDAREAELDINEG